MNSVKINFFRGSIFQPERFKLDAITVFIPAGLTAIRTNCGGFVKQFGKPTEKHEEFFLFKTNYKKDTLNSLRYVMVDRNKSHKIHEVKSWLINNDNNFKEICFIDLRDGFNKNIR